MSYVLNTPADIQAMLDKIGVSSVEELFRGIPDTLRFKRPLNVPPALQKAIAMAYIKPEATAPGTAVAVDVRGKMETAHVVGLPFYKRAR